MTRKGGPPDAKIAAIAARQHGVVSLGQLRDAGLSYEAVRGRAASSRLLRVHRGVYAVGHLGLDFEGRCMAAVLALGDAAVSHRSAAALWRMLPVGAGPIDASLLSRTGRKPHLDIRVHRPRSLFAGEVVRRAGIPVTTPARTVSDMRRTAGPVELRQAIRQAEVLGLSLGEETAGDRTRSELEHVFLRLCRRYDLPAPEVNVRVGGRIVDFLWREQLLIVETDGFRYHRGRAAFEDDRARDLELRTLGFEVLRLSHRQVTREPGQVAGVLRMALGHLSGDMARKGGPPRA